MAEKESRIKLWKYLFFIATAVCLLGRLLAEPWSSILDYCSKPLLIPLLFLYFKQATSIPWNAFVTTGLFFAWLGDLFLMVAAGELLLFLAGLLSFLIMQLLYIRLYLKDATSVPSILKSKPRLAIPSLGIGLVFYALLYPNLGPILKVAVGIYALALVSMTLAAINRYQAVVAQSFWNLTLGAFLFMFSDMMIGYNKFLSSIPYAGFWIMLTYALGQFLIIKGIILQYQPEH